jgi:nucleoside-diphosphate-sugar epimerase
MRVLVIGGTRFVGRATVEELLRRGDAVTVLHRGRTPNPFGERVEEIRADRQDPTALRTALAGQSYEGVVDVAYDVAAGTGGAAIESLIGALAPSAPRYVYVSSASIYRKLGMGTREDDPRASDPYEGDYPKNKAQAEEAVERAHRGGRITGTIVRPVFIYGPYDPIPRERWFWDRIVAGRPVIVPEQGGTIFHWTAASDVGWMAAESLRNPKAAGEAFNVAEAEPISHAAWVDRLAEAAGRSVEKVPVPRKQLETTAAQTDPPRSYFGLYLDSEENFSVEIGKARALLGFQPTDPRVGWKRAFEWYDREGRNPTPDFALEREILGR